MKQKYIAGDKVRCIGTYKKPIVEINEVRCDEYILEYHNGVMYHANYNEIEPIPLTAEILEKNGWEKVEDGIFEKSIFLGKEDNEELYDYFRAFYDKKDGWDIDKEDTPIMHNIHYVHQFQHLLFGLGFNSEIKM